MPEIPAPIWTVIGIIVTAFTGYIFRRPLFRAMAKEKAAQASSAESAAETDRANNAESMGDRIERLVKAKAKEVFEKQELVTENHNYKERIKFEKEERAALNKDLKAMIEERGGDKRELELIRQRNIEIERDFNNLRGEDIKCKESLAELKGRLDVLEARG